MEKNALDTESLVLLYFSHTAKWIFSFEVILYHFIPCRFILLLIPQSRPFLFHASTLTFVLPTVIHSKTATELSFITYLYIKHHTLNFQWLIITLREKIKQKWLLVLNSSLPQYDCACLNNTLFIPTFSSFHAKLSPNNIFICLSPWSTYINIICASESNLSSILSTKLSWRTLSHIVLISCGVYCSCHKTDNKKG